MEEKDELYEKLEEECHNIYSKGRLYGYVECQLDVIDRMLDDNVPLEKALGYVNLRKELYEACFEDEEDDDDE